MTLHTRPAVVESIDIDDTSVENAESSAGESSLRASNRLWLVVAVVLLAGVGVRLVNVGDPLFEFHPTRQYISVDLAWKYDIAFGAESAEGDREAAQIRTETEPPIMEVATAAIWRVMGDRPLWVPRLLTIAVWTAGGVLLALLLRRLALSGLGVVTGVIAWTLLPFVVQATRVFQPDPLMVVTILLAVLALVVDDERRTTRSLVLAGVAAGFAVFVKVPAVFFVGAMFLALTWFGRGPRALLSRRSIVFGALALPLAIIYNVLGAVVIGFLNGKENNFVFPRMLVTWDFWDSWLSLTFFTFTGSMLLLAGVGIGIARGRARIVGLALAAGYVGYGVVFTWNYSTHDYYHLPLVLIVALGVALLATELERFVRRRRGDLPSVGLATAALVLFVGAWATSAWPFLPPQPNMAVVDRRIRVWEDVGDAIGHSDQVFAMVHDYGYPLAYYGSVRSKPWPAAGDFVFETARGDVPVSIDDRFDELSAGVDPEFFVVTDFTEWERQPELQAFLRARYPVYVETSDYLVFDLRSNVVTGD